MSTDKKTGSQKGFQTGFQTIGIVGSGTMGTGIAQVAAMAGQSVVIADRDTDALAASEANLNGILGRLAKKEKITEAERDRALARISFASDLEDLAPSGVVIEAIVEDLEAKQRLFRNLEGVVSAGCILATNTSSLSVSAIAGACQHPGRVVGMHFFNPAPLLPLVEVVASVQTLDAVKDIAYVLAQNWGKVPVMARDLPGFIVNRIARPFYGEALRLLDEGVADVPTIDWAMREIGGFRMGPFELMDLIGNDVNFAVTRSVYEAFYHDPRYRPSITQQRMVEAGFLGRKSGRGYYDYAPGAPDAVPTFDQDLARSIVDRITAMLMNEAVDAVFWNVASPEDIDLAMTKGVNYPRGLLQWADETGAAVLLGRINALRERYAEDRYRPSPMLVELAQTGRKVYGD